MLWTPPAVIQDPFVLGLSNDGWVLGIGFLLLPVCLVAFSVYVTRKQDKKRAEELGKLSGELNLSFYSQGDESGLQRFLGFQLFSDGANWSVTNLLSGTAQNVEVIIFDFQYLVGRGHEIRQSVICLHSSTIDLPKFELRPEGIIDKIEAAVGYQDIDFDQSPEFSSKYLLRGEDEPAVRRLFGGRALNYFVAHEKVWVEGRGDLLLVYRPNQRVRPEEMREFIDEGFRIFDLFSNPPGKIQA